MAYHVFHKNPLTLPIEFAEVSAIAEGLRSHLSSQDIAASVDACNTLHASSQQVQAIIQPELERLHFQSEKTGLFSSYKVSALRPDFYRPVGSSGIILEVERGKILTNNMDLLDLWKCHVCTEADFLFLVVPIARRSENGTVIKGFDGVVRRLATFFDPKNYVNVEAVFVFGY